MAPVMGSSGIYQHQGVAPDMGSKASACLSLHWLLSPVCSLLMVTLMTPAASVLPPPIFRTTLKENTFPAKLSGQSLTGPMTIPSQARGRAHTSLAQGGSGGEWPFVAEGAWLGLPPLLSGSPSSAHQPLCDFLPASEQVTALLWVPISLAAI